MSSQADPSTTNARVSLGPPLVTLVAVVIATVAAFIGGGALGGVPVAEAADGWLSADATPLAPAGTAFSIWGVIYTGLALYALWQLTPTARASSRQRALRPWIAGSALLNAAWLGAVQVGVLWLSVVVIVLLLLVLIRVLLLMISVRSSGWLETLLVDGTMGLYLGWVCVAVIANVSAFLAAAGLDEFGGWKWSAVGVLLVGALIGVAVAVYTKGRLAPALATSWGLAWIAVGRSQGQFESGALVWTAALSAALVLLVAVGARARRGRAVNRPGVDT